jgi:hypothetical protein
MRGGGHDIRGRVTDLVWAETSSHLWPAAPTSDPTADQSSTAQLKQVTTTHAAR